jgi:hypothetical protein
MSGTPLLREMAAIAPPPWAGIFAAHRNALLLLVREIDAITKSNRALLERGQLAAREAIASLGELDVDTEPRERLPGRSPGLHLVAEPIDVRDPGAGSP